MKKMTKYLLILILAFATCFTSFAAKKSEGSDSSTSIPYPKKGWYTKKEYTVGDGIPSGEYILVSTKKNNNLLFSLTGPEAAEHANGAFSEMISDSCISRRYIIVKDGQKLSLQNAKLIQAEKMPPYKSKDNTWPGGMYKVGYDIPAGTYKVSAPKSDRCPTYVFNTPNARTAETHTIIMPGKSKEFAVSDGQYIQLQYEGKLTLVSES